nr:olfactory receptor 5AN1-like [Manis javanica]
MIRRRNITEITHFILLGFSDFPRIKAVLFFVFLVIYVITLTWNLSLIILIRMDSHLHTPMYFFLSNLSFLDICYVTSTAPKMLSDFFQEQHIITLVGCAVQYFFFSAMGLTETCLMTAMAYDRYAAICNPLLSIMKITTAKGRSKAFNTCASHLTVVSLFYTSSSFVYLSSSSGGPSNFDRFASVFYTVVIPMLNPLIYSLRNKEIKDALKRLQKKGGYC